MALANRSGLELAASKSVYILGILTTSSNPAAFLHRPLYLSSHVGHALSSLLRLYGLCSQYGGIRSGDMRDLIVCTLLLQVPGSAPYLKGIFAFNYSALASLGLSASALSGMKYALPKLIRGKLQNKLLCCTLVGLLLGRIA